MASENGNRKADGAAVGGDLGGPDVTLRRLIERMAGFGDRPALLALGADGEEAVGYGDLAARVGRLTPRFLPDDGGEPRRVMMMAANGIDWVAACLAVINAGGTVLPVDARLDDESLEHVLADSKPHLILAGDEERERLGTLAPGDYLVRPLAEATAEPADGEALGAAGLPDIDPDDTAVVFYTSGTTGPPKGVPLSHRNLMFQLQRLLDIGLMEPGERLLLPLPLHHVYPLVVGLMASFVYGIGIVLPQSLSGPHIVEAIGSGRVATIIGVPRLYEALLSGVETRVAGGGRLAALAFRTLRQVSLFARRRLSLRLGRFLFASLHKRIGPDLRLLASGGAALDDELAWTLEALGWTVTVGYGLTETAPLLSIVPPGDTHFATAGKVIPGVDMRIAPLAADDSDEKPEAPEGSDAEIGEIQVRGPNVFAGYHNLPDRTAEAFTDDGWYRTEDRGWIDDAGYVHVLGRASTFVVTAAGKNISLEELERHYERHPMIKEVGLFLRDKALRAVAVPDPAALRKLDDQSPEEAVEAAVREAARSLPRYKRIDELAVSRNALARTRLGKIRRDKLRERFDALRAEGGGGEATGPLPIDEMSDGDQALLEHQPAREVWNALAKRFPQVRLTPDSHVGMDLGIDSLEWISVTLDIRQRTGVELSEEATGRIETVRDLLSEVIDSAGRSGEAGARLEDDPEAYLSDDQKRWLEPLSGVEAALAWLFYQLNRLVMRGIFRLRVSGTEALPQSGNVVLAPNHLSVLDPFVLAAALPYDRMRQTSFAGWTGIAFANPVFRFFSRLGRTLPIQQDRAAFSSLALALVTLRRGGDIVWFPEGSRSRDGRLHPFKPGIGILLANQEATVVPVGIAGTFDAMPPGARLPRPKAIAVHFGTAQGREALQNSGSGDSPEERIADALHREVAGLQQKRLAQG